MHTFRNLLTYVLLLPFTSPQICLDFILAHFSKSYKWTVCIPFEAFTTLKVQIVVLWVITLQSGEHNVSAFTASPKMGAVCFCNM